MGLKNAAPAIYSLIYYCLGAAKALKRVYAVSLSSSKVEGRSSGSYSVLYNIYGVLV